FLFSSRRRHTRSKRDWSSDVCSSDLTKHCGPFLIDLIQVAKQRDKQMKAYVFGFITHHLLDRSTHPYIHYRAGYEGSKHQKLEVQIDTLMMEKYHRLKT